jgi:hypothetical protein
VVTGCGCILSLHLLVLTVSSDEMRFEVCPIFFNGNFLVPPTTCGHEVACCKDFCIPHVDLLGVTDEDASCFLIVRTILDLLEQGLNGLLGIPSPAHVLEVDPEVDRGDVPVSLEEVIQHVSC